MMPDEDNERTMTMMQADHLSCQSNDQIFHFIGHILKPKLKWTIFWVKNTRSKREI